jgi:hypothetical protein
MVETAGTRLDATDMTSYNQQANVYQSPYELYKESEGLPTLRGLGVPSLLELELTPWNSRGGSGVFINLEGTGGFNDTYVCEIPPGKSLNPIRHIYEETLFILKGRGATTVWLEEDKFWAAVVEMDMPLTVHVQFSQSRDSGTARVFQYPIEPEPYQRPAGYVERLARYGIRSALNVVQMVMSGLFDRFPTLNIFWAESQIGWIPIYLEQMDHNYTRHRHWAETVFGMKPMERLPSDYIKEHMYWGFFDDPIGIKLRQEIGVDRIMWGGDFPHVESDWPNSRALLAERFIGVPEEEQHKMVARNAVEFFHLDAV